jgi:glycosyltransferase involved in cell wall biosynthesis
MRVAFFTPVSPQKTGISDYSEQEILPHLAKFCDIDIFIDENVTPSNKTLINDFDIYPYSVFPTLEKNYDIPVYQMGNNPMHKFVYDTLIQYPGVVVLHDIFLHGFLWNMSLAQGDANKYIDTFKYCYGKKGEKIAQTAVSTGVFPEFQYPLIKKIIDKSLGVISHSNYGINLIMKENRESIAKKIDQPYTIPDPTRKVDPQQIKSELGLTKFSPVISSFGFIFSHKRYNIILKSFNRFLAFYPNAILILVGEDRMNLRQMISDLGLAKSVLISEYIPHDKVQKYLDISDFCINLRYPTAGETSRSVLQIMASKKPVIVTDVGWFSELPDDACFKVGIDSSEEEILLQYMIALSSNEILKNTVGNNARNFVIKKHDPNKISFDYFSFLKNIVNCNEYIINTISGGLSELNIYENEIFLFEPTVDRIKGIL